MLYNFATASVSPADLTARLNDIQSDAIRFLNEGGISRLNAEMTWRGEAAALIRQSVEDTFAMTDLTPQFLERRTGTHGDTYEFEQLVNTLRVVEYSPKSDPQIFTPRKGKWTISTSMFEMAYGIDLFKVLRRQHTIGEFVSMAGEAWSRFYATLAMKTVDTACASGVTDLKGRAVRTAAAGANVAKAEIDAALRRMYAGNGSGLTIFGSRYALDPIFDMGATTEQLKNDLNARGQIGTYRGAKLVEIKDDFNQFSAQFTKVNGLDMEKLIFIGSGTPGAILLQKDMTQFDWETLDVKAGLWATGQRADVGTLCHTPSRYHVIQLA
jgi:hypothetical protein